jgi:hypothetical protein
MHDNFILKKNIFFHQYYKIFTTRKILKMENKHPEHFWEGLRNNNFCDKKIFVT